MKYFALTLAVAVALCASRATSQTFTTLVQFTGNGGTAIGFQPYGSLTLSGTTLYGMTSEGGPSSNGNIFSVGIDGTNYQNLVSFTGRFGSKVGNYPFGSLTLAGSTFYGTTDGGGADGYGNIFSVGTNGTSYQTLLSFTGTGGAANGAYPQGDLILVGTTFYGTTNGGGAAGRGNIFSVAMDGSDYQDLHDFALGASGYPPWGDLTSSGGTLFGMTPYGGTNNVGTLFALTLPAAPTPEPGTLALLATGAICLVGYGLRRRRKVQLAVEPTVHSHDLPATLSFPSPRTQATRRAA